MCVSVAKKMKPLPSPLVVMLAMVGALARGDEPDRRFLRRLACPRGHLVRGQSVYSVDRNFDLTQKGGK